MKKVKLERHWEKSSKFVPNKVMIAGGTGFLGYHSALKFIDLGIEVGAVALPSEIDLEGWFPKEIELSYGNLFEMSEQEIYELFKGKGFDSLVYGLGPDDRVTPKAPAYEFFKLRLVDHCKKICLAAKKAGMKRCIIMNSYFSYFDRKFSGKLSKNHPYICARIEQENELSSIGETGVFDVMFIEIPYVFGIMPNREPIWKKAFIDRFNNFKQIYFPNGGTVAIDVEGVAESVVAATINGTNGGKYAIGKENIMFKDMINIMMNELGIEKHFVAMPAALCYLAGLKMQNDERKIGNEGGLHLAKLMTQIQSKQFFYDYTLTQKELGFDKLGFTGGKNVRDSIAATMRHIKEMELKNK